MPTKRECGLNKHPGEAAQRAAIAFLRERERHKRGRVRLLGVRVRDVDKPWEYAKAEGNRGAGSKRPGGQAWGSEAGDGTAACGAREPSDEKRASGPGLVLQHLSA